VTVPLWLAWLGVNVLLGLCHPSLAGFITWLPPLPRSLVVNAVLFVLPAIGWGAARRRPSRSLGMRMAFYLVTSVTLILLSVAVFALCGIELTTSRAWTAVLIVTNAGFAWAAWRTRGAAAAKRRSLLSQEHALAALLFAGSYVLYYLGATRVVPPQVDHDLEVQATGFSLLNRLEPLLLTDRGGLYYFAHPPLLHFLVGSSFLLQGKLEELEYYDQASRRAQELRAGRPIAPLTGMIQIKGRGDRYRITGIQDNEYLLTPEVGGDEERISLEDGELARIYMRYGERPHLLETRTPNLFFASLTVAILGLLTGRISRRWWMGFLVAVVYAGNPEVFVRASYGGYFAIGGLVSILLLVAAAEWWRRPVWGGIGASVGAFAALADHKLVLLPAAIAMHALVRGRAIGRQVSMVLRHPVLVGFAAGTLCFWLYGFAISQGEFIQDHFFHHMLDRVTHTNPLGYKGYATPLGLWLELATHSGYVILPVAVGLLVYDLVRRTPRIPAPEVRARELWLVWMALTAVVFTLTDWRMTKHVVLLLLPLHLALVPHRGAGRWRIGVPVAVLVIALAYDVWALRELATHFGEFTVTPAW
jgi:hypothetical protein